MHGKLPEIYWYLFWIGFVILAFRMAYLGGKSGYDTRMKALDILKLYAEKGTEPPPAMMQELTDRAFEKPEAKKDPRFGLMSTFNGFLFMACVSWGVRAWLVSNGAPLWQTIALAAALAFFGIGAFGFLLAALLSPRSK